MKKLGLMIALVWLTFTLVAPTNANATTPLRPANAGTTATVHAASVPWDSGPVNICFGGAQCGGENTVLVVDFSQTYIRQISVYAHDNVGNSTNAVLQAYAYNPATGQFVFLGEQDVKKAGSWLTYPVNRTTTAILFRSRHIHNPGGDETVVQRIILQ
jgi:hypothetical protein